MKPRHIDDNHRNKKVHSNPLLFIMTTTTIYFKKTAILVESSDTGYLCLCLYRGVNPVY